MSILVDNELKYIGSDILKPFEKSYVQPASIDLRLGSSFRVFRRRTLQPIDLAAMPPADEISKEIKVPLYRFTCDNCGGSGQVEWEPGRSAYSEDPTQACPDCGGRGQIINPDGFFVIQPGEFVLGSTFEHITVPSNLAMQLCGKSSLARIGLLPHVEAGWFDPGWKGIGTLEIVNLGPSPIILRPGLKICQSKWMRLSNPPTILYGDERAGSHYQGGERAEGSRYEG